MKTEYGFKHPVHGDIWCIDQQWAEGMARDTGYTLIAREVSDARVVSIRG